VEALGDTDRMDSGDCESVGRDLRDLYGSVKFFKKLGDAVSDFSMETALEYSPLQLSIL
jgi:hypothetical protein